MKNEQKPQVENDAAAAAAALATAITDALSSSSTNSRSVRSTGRITDDSRTIQTRDSAEQKTSDVLGEEAAALMMLGHTGINFANNKAVSDVAIQNLFAQQADRALLSLQANSPIAAIVARTLSDGANFSAAMQRLIVERASDTGVAKHYADLDARTERDDLAFRGTLRDESQSARGSIRDQDAIGAILVRALGSLEPIIIERLREDKAFLTAFVTLLADAIKGAAS